MKYIAPVVVIICVLVVYLIWYGINTQCPESSIWKGNYIYCGD